MNEHEHSTPAADKGRGRGSAGRALIADDSIVLDEQGEINLVHDMPDPYGTEHISAPLRRVLEEMFDARAEGGAS